MGNAGKNEKSYRYMVFLPDYLHSDLKDISNVVGIPVKEIIQDVLLHFVCGKPPQKKRKKFGHLPEDMQRIYSEISERGVSFGYWDDSETFDVVEDYNRVTERFVPDVWDIFNDLNLTPNEYEIETDDEIEDEIEPDDEIVDKRKSLKKKSVKKVKKISGVEREYVPLEQLLKTGVPIKVEG